MSNQEYVNKLIGGIGRVKLATKVSNAFPLVGETVTLEAVTNGHKRCILQKEVPLTLPFLREKRLIILRRILR